MFSFTQQCGSAVYYWKIKYKKRPMFPVSIRLGPGGGGGGSLPMPWFLSYCFRPVTLWLWGNNWKDTDMLESERLLSRGIIGFLVRKLLVKVCVCVFVLRSTSCQPALNSPMKENHYSCLLPKHPHNSMSAQAAFKSPSTSVSWQYDGRVLGIITRFPVKGKRVYYISQSSVTRVHF